MRPGTSSEPGADGTTCSGYATGFGISRRSTGMGTVLGCCRNFWGHFGGNAFRDGLLPAVNSEGMRLARDMLLGRDAGRPEIPWRVVRDLSRHEGHGQVAVQGTAAKLVSRDGSHFAPLSASLTPDVHGSCFGDRLWPAIAALAWFQFRTRGGHDRIVATQALG